MSDQVLSVKDWGTFQQYKDRNPQWIKFHLAVLDDYEFSRLPDTAKAHLLLIWLLAARCDNRIPYDVPWIAQRIGVREKNLQLERLLKGGWLFVREVEKDRTDVRTDVRTDLRTDNGKGSVAPEEKRREETETDPRARDPNKKPEFAEQF
ncbi:hypothetical protein LCGC14_2388020 [marine sediment metagenome]|uniref:Uncharacterized protein n=1 Tax=marine sediment metagenome TaxID=412755 RepID=A0A0F9ETI9_9ZZZZ